MTPTTLLLVMALGAAAERSALPADLEATYTKVMAAVAKGTASEVQQDAELLVERAPGHARSWYAAGKVHHALLQMRPAETDLETAVELGLAGERRADALSILAEIAFHTHRLPLAVRYAEASLAGAPDDVRALAIVGEVALQAGDLERAEELSRRLLAVDPGNASAHARLGRVLATTGSPGAALLEIASARRLGETDPTLEDVESTARWAYGTKLAWQGPLVMACALAVLLLAFFYAGKALSTLELRQLEQQDAKLTGTHETAAERREGRAYHAVLWAGVALYYVSVPAMLVITAGVGAGLAYGVLQLPHFSIKLMYLALLVGFGGLMSVARNVFDGPPDVLPKHELSEPQAPRLFALLREVAQVAGSRPVDRVFLVPDAGAGVREVGGRLQVLFGRGKRVLYLGYSTLDALSVEELKAVLAHEYGHFSHGETRLTPLIIRVDASAARIVAEIGALGVLAILNPVWWFLRLYLGLYRAVTAAHSRRRELLADRASALAFGGQCFGRALAKVGEAGSAFARGLVVLCELRHFGMPATNPYRVIGLAHRAVPEALRKLLSALEQSQPATEYDSHPPIAERIARVAGLV
ncbi:MAG: M48 family metallopeptidase, partial [Myxococcaceae bacterium]